MKFFSLSKEDILLEAGKKIISEEKYLKLVNVDEIIEKAKNDAIDHIEEAKKEGEELKKEAEKKGFEEGLEKLNLHILKLDEKLKDLEKEYEKKILQIAYKACKKIIGIELKSNPEVIVDIIKEALKPISQHLKVKIFVNKEDLDILEKEKEELKKSLHLVQMFSLEERNDISPGGCVIETEKGIINAQIENQFKALEKAFKAFEKK